MCTEISRNQWCTSILDTKMEICPEGRIEQIFSCSFGICYLYIELSAFYSSFFFHLLIRVGRMFAVDFPFISFILCCLTGFSGPVFIRQLFVQPNFVYLFTEMEYIQSIKCVAFHKRANKTRKLKKDKTHAIRNEK